MMIHEITPHAGRYRRRKRVGRGTASGKGKTSGRGHKGAGSRSGATGSIRASYEGGQMAFYQRLPKVGFSNSRFAKRFYVVNLRALDTRFDDGAEVNPDMLVKAGLIRDTRQPVKVLGSGEISKKLTVTAGAFSKSAQEKIEKAGGSTTVV